MEAYLSLAAFPDVKPGLEALKKQGVKLAILSNGETRMLEAAAKSAGIRDLLDDIISVEEVKIFKVSPRVYSLAPERMKVTNPELGFISANSWDINGAAVWPTRSISCSESSRFQQKDRLRIIVAPSAIQHWGTAAPSRSPPPCNSEMMPCSCSRPEWMKSSSSCKFLMNGLGGLETAARRRPQIGGQSCRPDDALLPPIAGGDQQIGFPTAIF